MKLVIFAGGIGSRLWPLSRENSPKQFDRIFNGKSTLELAWERVSKHFEPSDIFVQTVENYKATIQTQLPGLLPENIIIEPMRRNLAPAVCLATLELARRGYKGAMAILWADHLMKKEDEFIRALTTGEHLIKKDPKRFIFLGEKPRFANNNLGWVKLGEKKGEIEGVDYHVFSGWRYKPGAEECEKLFESGQAFWNPGYFITSVEFLLDRYKSLAPAIYEKVEAGQYEQAEATHFDRAIIEKVDLSRAVVIKTEMGWSDPGTLYALKEALEESLQENVLKGQVATLNTSDSLVYNLENKKLVTTVGLKGMVVVNTPDALLVVPKEEVINITELLKIIKDQGQQEYL